MKIHIFIPLCCVLLFCLQANAQQKEVAERSDSIYTIVEQMPSFPGGEAEMMKYVSKNLIYPTIAKESGIQGRFTARFVVNEEGEIKNIKVIRGIDPSVDSINVAMLKNMPKWIPSKQRGKAVSVYFTLPIMICFR